jgi:hypothetical protein
MGNGTINGATDGQNVMVDAGSTGSYTLTLDIVDANVCANSCMSTVTVNANPSCSIMGPAAVCAGTTGQSYSGPAGMSVYTWTIMGNGTINGATDGQNVMVDAGSTGSYTLTLDIVDANGCMNSCMSTVTVNANPLCSIMGPGEVCAGSTGHGYSAPAGMSVYTWTIMGNGTINGATDGQNVTVDAGSAGNISLHLTMIDMNGCTNSCTYPVIVNAQDDASFSYSAAAFCKSGNDPSPLITGMSGGSFTSTPAGLNLSSTSGIINLNASTPGSYTVTYTTNGPCVKSSSQAVKIDQAIPSVNAGVDQQICGLSTTLAANNPSVGAGLWSIVSGTGGTIANPGSYNSGFSGVGGNYTLRWTISNGSCAIFDLVEITLQDLQIELPAILGPPTICHNLNNIPYSVAPQSGVTNYIWSYSGTGVAVHSDGGPNVTVDFGANATAGILSVTAINPCGGTNANRQLNIQLGNISTCSFVNCLVSNLLVSDNTLILPGSPQIFKVSDQISSNATMPSPKTFLFKAGDSVNLLPGFKVNGGAVFMAEIEECPLIFPFQSSR